MMQVNVISFLFILLANLLNGQNYTSNDCNFYEVIVKNETLSVQCDTLELIDYCLSLKNDKQVTNLLQKNLYTSTSRESVSYRNKELSMVQSLDRQLNFYVLYYVYFNLFLNEEPKKFNLIYISKDDKVITGNNYGNKKEQKEIEKIYLNYDKWVKSIKEIGLKESRKKGLSPFKKGYKFIRK